MLYVILAKNIIYEKSLLNLLLTKETTLLFLVIGNITLSFLWKISRVDIFIIFLFFWFLLNFHEIPAHIDLRQRVTQPHPPP